MTAVLRECINTNGIDTIRIATGFWDLPGMALVESELRQFLVANPEHKLKLLIGKDAYVYASMLKEPKFKDASYPDDYIRIGLDELADNLKEEHLNALQLLLDFCKGDNPQIEVRKFKHNENDETQFLHSKCYVFTSESKKSIAYGIVGSSNFTKNGLEGNAELNYLENSAQIVRYDVEDELKGHVGWFEEKWTLADDWTKEFLEQVVKKSKAVEKLKEKRTQPNPEPEPQPEPQPEELTPYETYIKLLQDKFGDMLDKNMGSLLESYLPNKYQILDYQMEAAKQCITIMHTHGGFLLGDVVGLGKTIVGVLTIKYFLEAPENDGREKNVLIIAPPAIVSSWKRTINDFDEGRNDKITRNVDFVTTGSIADVDDETEAVSFRDELKEKNYGLIVIDESHNFRNRATQMYEALDKLIANIGLDTGFCPYIGLLSATPQNNHPYDLRNQILLFQRTPQATTLEKVPGRNLETYFSSLGREFDDAVAISKFCNKALNRKDVPNEDKVKLKEDLEKAHNDLKEISKDLRDKVLSDIMVRRTRSDIKNPNNHYQAKIEFPEVIGPMKLEYQLGKELAQLFIDTSNIIGDDTIFNNNEDDDGQISFPWITEQNTDSEDGIQRVHYYRYRATIFLKHEKDQKKYEGKNMSVNRYSRQLAKIMQMLLVKRLESSLDAFKESLRNFQRYTNNMIQMWNDNRIFICPDIDVNAELNLEVKRQKYGKDYTIEKCYGDIVKSIKNLPERKNKKKENAEYTRDSFNPDYIEMLLKDKALIDDLVDRWNKNTRDPKLGCFNRNINVLFDKERNRPQKLVVFSEAISTTDAIVNALEDAGYRTLKITADNRDKKELTIRENFDANYDKAKQKNDYDAIVTTEVLAEGVNLHRANTILNYDTPWNATKLIQRIGRVNRIGSTEKNVYVYNFYPSPEGDKTINLVQTAYSKLQSFHTLFGEDSKIFSDDEELSHNDLNTLIDGEESPYTPFVNELKAYQQQNPERYRVIAEIKSSIQTAFKANDNVGTYCLVKTEGVEYGGVYVCVGWDGKPVIHNCIEVLAHCKCTPDTVPTDLPSDIDTITQRAINEYNKFAKKQFERKSNKTITAAKGIIQKLIAETPGLDAESKNLLDDAFQLVNNRNESIAKKIININSAIENEKAATQTTMMPINQVDIDNLIKAELKNVAIQVAREFGNPYVFITINKQ